MPTRFERDLLSSTAWKNAGGHTREIARIPPAASIATFDWRASIADISADGPFSPFGGVDRVIVLLNGDGVRLRSTDGTVDHLLDEALVPFAFAGEDAIVASLIGGASSDFNVMTRRGTAHADVRVVRSRKALVESPAGVLFAARGTWDVRATRPVSLNAGEPSAYSLQPNSGVWWEAEPQTWEVAPQDPDGALIAVRIAR